MVLIFLISGGTTVRAGNCDEFFLESIFFSLPFDQIALETARENFRTNHPNLKSAIVVLDNDPTNEAAQKQLIDWIQRFDPYSSIDPVKSGSPMLKSHLPRLISGNPSFRKALESAFREGFTTRLGPGFNFRSAILKKIKSGGRPLTLSFVTSKRRKYERIPPPDPGATILHTEV